MNPRIVLACALVLFPVSQGWAQASSIDDAIGKILTEKKLGVALLDVMVGPRRRCDHIDIYITRKSEGQWRVAAKVRGSSWFFAQQTRYGGMPALKPDEYRIGMVDCVSGNHHTRLIGPYARFNTHAGELTNIGVLRLDYELEGFIVRAGTLRKSIEGMGPEARASLKQKIPRFYPRAVERRMTLLGPTEVKIKSR
jgi:hypothetical protein